MTDNPLAALLRDVPIRGRINAGRKCLDELVSKKDVLAALTLPDDEVGKLAERLRGGMPEMRPNRDWGWREDIDLVAVEKERKEAADLITRLLAARAADAERIRELEAEVAAKQATYDDLYADALADAKSDAQDFDSDLWREVRKYLTELHLDWRDYQDDGITAEQAVEYIRECMDEETRRAETAEARIAALTAQVERMRGALEKLHHAVCGETGFAACVRLDSGKAYPWPALDEADAEARAAITEEPK